MALPIFTLLQSHCTGVGYWTHFLQGAVVCFLFFSDYSRVLSIFLGLLLLTYQTVDFVMSEDEVEVTKSFAYFRDVTEYLLGGSFVLLGVYAERRRAALEKSLRKKKADQ